MPEPQEITVLVVDDHPLIRTGLCATISAQTDMTVIAEAATAEEAITAFQNHLPDIILMDLKLPTIGGVEAIRAIRSKPSKTKIIVVTTYEGDEDIYQALKAGAQGYVIKGMPLELLLEAIRDVNRGEQFLPPAVAQALNIRKPDTTLRPSEKAVLTKIVEGKSNKEIAKELCISEGTVKGHVSEILARLGAADRTHAAMIALQRGLAHL